MELVKDIIRFLIFIAIIFAIRMFIITPVEVVGKSMETQLKDGDWLIMERVSYYFNEVDRFDVVIIKYDDSGYIVKRVVGMPGDEIYYNNGLLYVNDKVMAEEFLADGIVTSNFAKIKVPDDKYFVVGDNRGDSYDSRNDNFGYISEDQIIGRAFLNIWPLSNFRLIK